LTFAGILSKTSALMSTSWKTVRVFISSTFRDMQAERDHLVRFVFPRLREQLLRRRVHLLDVDLRWGVTSEQDAAEVCREVIDECRPRFLCLIGGRYGTIPAGRQLSITADEIHFGVLDRPQSKLYAIFYFRHGAVTERMNRSTNGLTREPRHSEKSLKLAGLKRAIRRSPFHPRLYQPSWNAAGLLDLTEFGQHVEQDLLRSIDDELGPPQPAQIDEFNEEADAMDAFIEERSSQFILGSRVKILEQLLDHARAGYAGEYLCLAGAPGSGKSALLAYLSTHLDLSSYRATTVITHFVGASPNSVDIRSALRRLCHELKAACTDPTVDIPDDPEQLRAAFASFLRQASASGRIVIVIDAINQFDGVSPLAAVHWLPAALPNNVRVILSTLEGPALAELRRRNKPREIRLDLLTTDDSLAIIDQFLDRYRKRLDSQQRQSLLAKTDAGNPLYLRAALEELRTLGTFRQISDHIAQMPATTLELFTWILKRLQEDDGFRNSAGHKTGQELIPRFAALMGASRHGLSYRELSDLLEPGDPNGNLAALLRLLRPYLLRRGDLLDFFHGQFRAAVVESWLQTDTQRQAANMQLARYFQGRVHEPSAREVSELPYHMAAGGLDDELSNLVIEADYLEQCAALIGVAALLSCLNQSRSALRRDSVAEPTLTKVSEILQREYGSLADWRSERRIPDFVNQLVNGASARGLPLLFRQTGRRDGLGLRGSLWLQWSLGGSGTDLKQQLLVQGQRDSYAWDSYGFGPMSLKTNLWIDVPRGRLLTDTVSTWGSMDWGYYEDTHFPVEWDLQSGVLLVRHASEQDEPKKPRNIPKAFDGRFDLASMNSCEPASESRLRTLIDGQQPTSIKAMGRSVNSAHEVFSIEFRKLTWTFGNDMEPHLWVYDPIAHRAYATSHAVSGLTVQAIAMLENGLTVFATDDDGHVYRLSLVPKSQPDDEPLVLNIAVRQSPGQLGCVRSTGIEIRSATDGKLLHVFTRADLSLPKPLPETAKSYANTTRDPDELSWTPDHHWAFCGRKSHADETRLVPTDGPSTISNQVYSSHNGELLRRDWDEPSRYINPSDYERRSLLTLRGKYRLMHRRCSIDVWETESGRFLGTLGTGAQYGGGGNMYGIATHPSERFVISSDTETGELTAWDLDKDREYWRLQGIGPLGKIRSLAFLWGGYLVAALTEEHTLYVAKFWCQSEILAAIRLDEGCLRIVATPYGDRLFVLYEGGRLRCYRYLPRPGPDVTSVSGNTLNIRFRRAGAQRVNIAGTFNNWNPSQNPMSTQDGEIWHAVLHLPDGMHEYKIVIDEVNWELDPNTPFVPGTHGPNNYALVPP